MIISTLFITQYISIIATVIMSNDGFKSAKESTGISQLYRISFLRHFLDVIMTAARGVRKTYFDVSKSTSYGRGIRTSL